MPSRHFRIVVVGHVDHGKSTLIGRLLHDSGALPDGVLEDARRDGATHPEWAFLMDHLEEEREQERTIESAQAFFATPTRTYRIIDAPGHKEFLRNMVTGAAQADAAVLVVDVEAGVQEQTRRHAALLDMLGLRRVIVAINKMDRVGGAREAFDATRQAVETFLPEIGLAAAHVVPVSAMEGWNLAARPGELAWHDGPTLFEALDSLEPPKPPTDKPLRLPVQDVYVRNGRKVLVGRIESGRIAVGQTVLCLPWPETGRIASVERFREERTSASCGESIGVTLEEGPAVKRGTILCDPESPPCMVRRFEANVFWLGDAGWARGDPIVLRCTTQEVAGRIERVERRIDSSSLEVVESDASRLETTDAGRVEIALARPIAAEPFRAGAALGRFVLLKNGVLSAGGTVASIPGARANAGEPDE